MGEIGHAEYFRTRDHCERARVIAEEALRIAERHVAEHGCGTLRSKKKSLFPKLH